MNRWLSRSTLWTGVTWTAAVLAGGYVILVVRDFAHYSGHYPYMSFDDGLATIMNSVAAVGRYGDFGYPVHPPYDVPRHTTFFTYGPWYFYLGAALIWAFGFSIEMLRAIHPAVLISTVGLAWATFGRDGGKVPAAAYALGIFLCFDRVQWPMVRPDIMVSLFAAAFLLATARAFGQGQARMWLVAGLCAGCAALSHLAAVSVVASCAAVFCVWAWTRRAAPATVLRAGVAMAAGLFTAVLMFYGSFGFKVRELLEVVFGYNSMRHLDAAYGTLMLAPQAALAFGLAIGVALAATAVRLEPTARARVWGLVLPPLVTLLLYQGSLAFYQNFHTGYAILSQVAAFWLLGAVLRTLADREVIRRPVLRRVLAITTAAGVCATGALLSAGKLEQTSDRAAVARRWVGISEYTAHLIDELPRGFYGWGAYMFVPQLPDRAEVVNFDVALRVSAAKPDRDRQAVAPDYLVWGPRENLTGVIANPGMPINAIERLQAVFSELDYRVVRLVGADPYGVSRIYQRRRRGEAVDLEWPEVSAWEAETQQWVRGVAGPAVATWGPAKEFCYELEYQGTERLRCAARAVMVQLDPGW